MYLLSNFAILICSQLNSSKDEVKSVQEKMEKQKKESEKKLEDEKKLTDANNKSHQAEMQNKQDVSLLNLQKITLQDAK